jgi:hypothetical protein
MHLADLRSSHNNFTPQRCQQVMLLQLLPLLLPKVLLLHPTFTTAVAVVTL